MSTPQLPAGLPPLPDGLVCLGLGTSFIVPRCGHFEGCAAAIGETRWIFSNYEGILTTCYYAAPIDSEIARLNGHGVEPAKPAADSEAVALVRKLVIALNQASGVMLTCPGVRAVVNEAVKESAAFLAKEETKS